MTELPIACSLTSAELQDRRQTILKSLRGAVVEVRELEDGFLYQFPSRGPLLSEIASMIELERQCCPFLRFSLTVEANGGPIALELTGPSGTKEFLKEIFG